MFVLTCLGQYSQYNLDLTRPALLHRSPFQMKTVRIHDVLCRDPTHDAHLGKVMQRPILEVIPPIDENTTLIRLTQKPRLVSIHLEIPSVEKDVPEVQEHTAPPIVCPRRAVYQSRQCSLRGTQPQRAIQKCLASLHRCMS